MIQKTPTKIVKQVQLHSENLNFSSQQKEQIKYNHTSKNNNSQGIWDNLMQRTSQDGFSHGPARNLSPQNKKQNTEGHWEQLMQKSSQDGFYQDKFMRNKKGQKQLPSHFEKGTCVVQVNDEGGLWNRKPLQKYNNQVKESHVFDSVKYSYNVNDKGKFVDNVIPQYIKNYRSDYNKFYNQQKTDLNSEYNNQFDPNSAQKKDFDTKVKPRKALPKPKMVEAFLEYKKTHDCLNY